jgi:hypothetical protein
MVLTNKERRWEGESIFAAMRGTSLTGEEFNILERRECIPHIFVLIRL